MYPYLCTSEAPRWAPPCPTRAPSSWLRGLPPRRCDEHTANFHTKNCRTENLRVKIPKSLR